MNTMIVVLVLNIGFSFASLEANYAQEGVRGLLEEGIGAAKATTRSPSKSPSRKPSRLPTLKPTTQPSRVPTMKPTSPPTSVPLTKVPSSLPTAKPSTLRPSFKPSITPTGKIPSSLPTRRPTSSPTTRPSIAPTSTTCPSGQTIAISSVRLNTMITGIGNHICTEGGGQYVPPPTPGPGQGPSTVPPKCANFDASLLGSAIGGVLRLSFHDSVTYSPTDNSGGPDGCIDFTDMDNGGLKDIWNSKVNAATAYTLNDLYASQYAIYTSKADFIALAANVAVLLARGPDISGRTGAVCTCIGTACATASTTAQANPCVAFRWGRTDSTSCAISDKGRFPSSQLAHQHILDVFQTRLGFTNSEIVALTGAHSVGRARLNESHIGFTTTEATGANGLSGRWDNSPNVFDNAYFSAITSVPWEVKVRSTQEDGKTTFTPSVFQWADVNKNTELMLNTDLALVWDVTPSPTNALAIKCNPNRLGGKNANNPNLNLFAVCSENTLFSTYAFNFAANQSSWFAEWVSAWTKMQEMGWTAGAKGALNAVTSATCL